MDGSMAPRSAFARALPGMRPAHARRLAPAHAGISAAAARLAATWRSRRLHAGLVAALLALGGALRVGLILRGWPALDSDEAIIGLMARHIVDGSERPTFYYGQHYLGALDAYITAAFFRVLGPTTLALHLAMLPLVLCFLLAMYWLGRAAYGPAVGLLTLAYLALGPAFGLLRETASIGGYQETLLLAAILSLLVYARLRRSSRLPRGRVEWLRALAQYAAIGLVAGLGIWSDQLILPFVVAGALALGFGRRREMLHLPGVALVGGLVLGAWPFVVFNLQTGGQSFAELSLQNHPASQVGPLPPLPAWAAQVGETLSAALPAVLGSPHVCISQGGAWVSYPPAQVATAAQPGGLCGALNVLFSLGVLGCYAVVAWQLWRPIVSRWRGGRVTVRGVRRVRGRHRGRGRQWRASTPAAGSNAGQSARLWLRGTLLVAAMGTIALYTLSNTAQRYQFTAARYLLALYVTLPLVFGVLWEVARRAALSAVSASSERPATPRVRGRPLAQPSIGRRIWGAARIWLWGPCPRAGLAVAGLALLLGFAVNGAVATTQRAADTALFALPAPAADQRLIALLAAQHITRFTSDYWTCYRLALESEERLRCAVRVRDGSLSHNVAINRYQPYLLLLERTPNPAYVFPTGGLEDTTFDQWAAARGLPHMGYARVATPDYAVYYLPGGQG